MRQVISFDIGGPLFDHLSVGEPSIGGDDFLEVPEVAGAFDAIASFADRFGDDRHAVFKCSPDIEERARAWLAHHAFYLRTGVAEDRVHYCRKDETKTRLIRSLGVTCAIDDSLSDLLRLRTVRKRILFRGRDHEIRRHYLSLRHVIRVAEWSEVAAWL